MNHEIVRKFGLPKPTADARCSTCFARYDEHSGDRCPVPAHPLIPHGALPTDSQARKDIPLARGVLFYFPDALAAVAELSRKGNDKHNPGQPLHWSRGKSNDHLDCLLRHVIDGGPDQTAVDPEDGVLHATKTAWRALANLQLAVEAARRSGAAAV